jgi:hypothetical protein
MVKKMARIRKKGTSKCVAIAKVASSVAKFIVHDWGDKVYSGIGLSYWPVRLYRLAGRYENPLCRSQLLYCISPIQGL